MLFIKSLMLCASTALAFTTVSQVEIDITIVDKNFQTLNAETSLYTGGAASASILASLITVHYSFAQSVADCALLPPSLSESDAVSLIEHINATLAIDNVIAVDTLKSKKAFFKAEGLDNAVVTSLDLLLTAHEKFTIYVLQRLPEDQVADGKKVTEVITLSLTAGIQYFQSA
ncbi:0d62f322-7367-4f4a-9349-7fbd618a8ba4-CDS [Sclerotinia trifoliorum]|uniref:0d62f322-7367-4f4a-9349-7fbd618a8ba4-CDS n=1 Tax=Sclerotinia trifoliorum TaxID=28548 RepID=A0A8H2W3X0_9HELO|nr:0d62f322-7367-4f4a-9349-7fbd618a8ba4-CDS [Sclerotinia trifoliorum]